MSVSGTPQKRAGQQGVCLVYALTDLEKGIRYVGKSSNGMYRPVAHMLPRLYNGPLKKTHLYNWIRKTLSTGETPQIIVVEYCGKENLAEREIYWIKKFRSDGFELCNGTNGGEGTFGRKWSEERKRKFSESRRGIKFSKEHVEKLRLAHIGIPSGRKGVRSSPSTIEKIKLAQAHRRKPIIEMTTGLIFQSIREAQNYFKLDKHAIVKNARGLVKNKLGLEFKFLGDNQ
jgi:group I intron endonuclease